jgi:hypothetical protein
MDEGGDLAGSLSSVLVHLLSENAERFRAFVNRASYEDAGQEAAVAVYGRGLETFLEGFLGPDDWKPRPEAFPWDESETVE